MTSLAQIKQWSDRYPFDEGELEILLRCHASTTAGKDKDQESFLNLLAHSFPYVFFFLPQDELEVRTSLVEQYVLPAGFEGRFKEALLHKESNSITNEEVEVERLINGVANSCRRKPEDALGVIFDCCLKNQKGMANLNHLIELCYSLSIASSVLVSKRIDQQSIKEFQQKMPSLQGLKTSLSKVAADREDNITKQSFIDWGMKIVPHLYACLPSFTHNLIFHGKSTNSHHQETLKCPELLDSSHIFTATNPSLSFTISCMAPSMGGKWRRLFTSEMEETPANCLQAAIGYHVGPSFFVIKTKSGSILGGCVESKWKVCYFLFQVEPSASIYTTSTGKFFVNHDDDYVTEDGDMKGFGFYEDEDDATKWSSSHVFFSSSLDLCVASFLGDKPMEIKTIEVWGFGKELYD